MRILVLGGTVFLSRTIVEHALGRGHDVTCAARGSMPQPTGARFVRANRDTDDGLAPLVEERFDAVIDVARHPSHVRRALRALGENCPHWTFVSTVSVYADDATPRQRADTAQRRDPLPDDADETDPDNYGAAKVTCEDLVAAAGGEKAFTVRAGLIGGPRDPNNRFGYWPLRLSRGGEVLAPGTPDDLVQFIDVADLAAWIVTAAEQRIVGTYDGVAPPMLRGEFLSRIAEAIGVPAQLTWVGQDFLLAREVNPWSGPRSLPMWLPLPEYAGLMAHDVSTALAAGLTIRDLGESARTTLSWERDREARGAQAPVAGLTQDEEVALLRQWRDAM
jgi:nucleoside-diphosphate-sugar epimerase